MSGNRGVFAYVHEIMAGRSGDGYGTDTDQCCNIELLRPHML